MRFYKWFVTLWLWFIVGVGGIIARYVYFPSVPGFL